MDFDVIIPVYRPDEKFCQVLSGIEKQVAKPRKIIIALTLEEGEKESDVLKIPGDFSIGTDIFTVKKSEFDHAATRRKAVERSDTPFFLMMTQDALPADEFLTKNLLDFFSDGVSSVYARQLAGPDSDEAERYSRSFNYPE